MKLWYTKQEMPAAEIEAQQIIENIMKDLHCFIKGDIQIRMAWKQDSRSDELIPLDDMRMYGQAARITYIPEAELLVNGEVCRRDLLDLLYIDILHLEMNLLLHDEKGDSRMLVHAENFNLDQIARSGQCFRWELAEDGAYTIPAFGRILKIQQIAPGEFEADCSKEDWEEIWVYYFDLHMDYAAIIAGIDPQDAYLRAAASYGNGIRILHQPLWETIASYIISQNNNIPRIKQSIHSLCKSCGGIDFPEPELVAALSEEELRKIGLGYRAEYIKRAAVEYSDHEKLRRLELLSYPVARNELMRMRGIGPKVADCICLYGLSLKDAFPVDTWIRKIVNTNYGGHFPAERYLGVQGVMQQYMFFYERELHSPASLLR